MQIDKLTYTQRQTRGKRDERRKVEPETTEKADRRTKRDRSVENTDSTGEMWEYLKKGRSRETNAKAQRCKYNDSRKCL